MKKTEGEKRGWMLVAILLMIGFLCVILAGNLAIRFAPGWTLNADMGSRLDPDTEYLLSGPRSIVPALDPAILTPPVWINVFLTPGVTVTLPTRVPQATAMSTNTNIAPRQSSPTAQVAASLTPSFVYFTATPVSNPTGIRTTAPPVLTATPTSSPGILPTVAPPSLTPSSVPATQADLQITKSNGVLVYSAGSPLTYTVIVSNNGPGDISGAVVTDTILPQITEWSWACTAQNNGASGCDPSGSSAASFSDTVDLPYGSSIVYTVMVNTSGSAFGNLVNTASIVLPPGIIDPVPGNNSAVDWDDLLNTFPYGSIGVINDYSHAVIPPGSSAALLFDPPLVVGGHPGWDLVLYESPNGSGIAMDLIILQISDGTSWYTILNWGDNLADTNSNMNINELGGIERDNRDFTDIPNSNVLYPFNSGTEANPATGIVIELDGVVPNGTYPYFRILSPAGGDMDGGCEIDAVVILP